MKTIHTSVLLHETINTLNLKKGDIFVDGTFGGGGHSALVCEQFGKKIQIIAFDQDKGALEEGKKRFPEYNITYINSNYRFIDTEVQKCGIDSVNGILFDIGFSSDQLENSNRGFSFMRNEPLLMTMNANPGNDAVTAYTIVNEWAEETIADILYGYGEEKFSRHIARAIVTARLLGPIETTFDLVKIIIDAVPVSYTKRRIHPATKTFQALRIAVNDELGALKDGLHKGFHILKKNGRLGVISFHSMEDRIVKHFMREKEMIEEGKRITKKPIIPTYEEIKLNPRSRSAKLRVIEKII